MEIVIFKNTSSVSLKLLFQQISHLFFIITDSFENKTNIYTTYTIFNNFSNTIVKVF